jgi:hypothetical protein
MFDKEEQAISWFNQRGVNKLLPYSQLPGAIREIKNTDTSMFNAVSKVYAMMDCLEFSEGKHTNPDLIKNKNGSFTLMFYHIQNLVPLSSLFNELINYFFHQDQAGSACLVTDVVYYKSRDIVIAGEDGLTQTSSMARCLEIEISPLARVALRAHRFLIKTDGNSKQKSETKSSVNRAPKNAYSQMILTDEHLSIHHVEIPKGLEDIFSSKPELQVVKAFQLMCNDMSSPSVKCELVFGGQVESTDGKYVFKSQVITCTAFNWERVSLEAYAIVHKTASTSKTFFSISVNSTTGELKLNIYVDVEKGEMLKEFVSAQPYASRKRLWNQMEKEK